MSPPNSSRTSGEASEAGQTSVSSLLKYRDLSPSSPWTNTPVIVSQDRPTQSKEAHSSCGDSHPEPAHASEEGNCCGGHPKHDSHEDHDHDSEKKHEHHPYEDHDHDSEKKHEHHPHEVHHHHFHEGHNHGSACSTERSSCQDASSRAQSCCKSYACSSSPGPASPLNEESHCHDHDHSHGHTHDAGEHLIPTAFLQPPSLVVSTLVPSTSTILPKAENHNGKWFFAGPDNGAGKESPESGPANIEHIVLGVQGMTCSHCANELRKELSKIPAIIPESIKTSVLISRADFNLNTSLTSAEGVINRINKTTTFRCSQVFTNGQYVDVILPDPAELDLANVTEYPPGVENVVILDKSTARVFYHAETVGIRSLLLSSFSKPLNLAPMRPDESLLISKKEVWKLFLLTAICAIPTIVVFVLSWAPMPSGRRNHVIFTSVSLALATIVQVIAAWVFYPAAFKTLFYSRMVEMDFLIAMSTTTAYVFSVIGYGADMLGSPLKSGEFFETSTMLVTLVLLGRLINELSRRTAASLVSVRSLQETTTELVTDGNSGSTPIDIRLLQYHDLIKIPPHSRVVTDGRVVAGTSELDESMVTGESVPVFKGVKSLVRAGSINGDGELIVRVTLLPCENTISQIANLVDTAKLEKPRIQQTADYVAGILVPAILVASLIVFFAQFGVRVIQDGKKKSDSAVDAITYAIATLIVSCPCAIGLAVPMVIMIATGVAAESGIIFKDPQAIESARKVDHVVFDKTGTLTRSYLQTEAEYIFGKDSQTPATEEEKADVRAMVLGLLKGNHHPVSKGVVRYLTSIGAKATNIADIKSVPGKGVYGSIMGENQIVVEVGNSRWMQCDTHPALHQIRLESMSHLCVRVDGYLVAIYGLQTPVRENAKEVINKLHQSGIQVHIVSGDDHNVVQEVGRTLGVPATNVRARASPKDKQDYVDMLRSRVDSGNRTKPSNKGAIGWLLALLNRKPKQPVVMFYGDGTNDAPALMNATIGVHMPMDTELPDPQAGTRDSTLDDDSTVDNATIVTTTKTGGTVNDRPVLAFSSSFSSSTSTSQPGRTTNSEVASASADVVLITADLDKVTTLIRISKSAFWRIRLNFIWAGVYNVIAILGASGALEGRNGWRIPPTYAAIGEVVSVLPVILIALTLRGRKIWTRLFSRSTVM